MLRTLIWFIYFWLFLIFSTPVLLYVNYLEKTGQLERRDRFMYAMARFWGRSLIWFAGGKITVKGAELLPREGAVVFVGNHQGNFDIPIMLGFVDKPKAYIAKIEISKMPIIGSWMRNFYCVFMDRSDIRQSLRVINEAVGYLQKGQSMVIYPEGTRSKNDTLGAFKGGSLKLALKAGIPIVPVTMRGSYKLMEKNGFIIKPAAVEVIISAPISTVGLTKDEAAALPDIVRNIILENLALK